MFLPLFPLGTVLFPGMPLDLHIFEPRYKDLVRDCVASAGPFGVILIEEGQEALGPLPTPVSIGCTANILEVNRLGSDRLTLKAVGAERFSIRELDGERHAYLSAEVELLPEVAATDAADAEQAHSGSEATMYDPSRLIPLVRDYLSALARSADSTMVALERLEPLALCYLAADVLQIGARRKQPFLECRTVRGLVKSLCTVYENELALLRTIRKQKEAGDSGAGPMSLN